VRHGRVGRDKRQLKINVPNLSRARGRSEEFP
jgi:hypothetical protein